MYCLQVTLCVEDTEQLSELENKLASKGLKYRTWLEKPDNEITALVRSNQGLCELCKNCWEQELLLTQCSRRNSTDLVAV